MNFLFKRGSRGKPWNRLCHGVKPLGPNGYKVIFA